MEVGRHHGCACRPEPRMINIGFRLRIQLDCYLWKTRRLLFLALGLKLAVWYSVNSVRGKRHHRSTPSGFLCNRGDKYWHYPSMFTCTHGVCVYGVTRSWSTLKKAIWHGLLRRLAKAIKASASSRFRIRTAAMKDIPCTLNTHTHTLQYQNNSWNSTVVIIVQGFKVSLLLRVKVGIASYNTKNLWQNLEHHHFLRYSHILHQVCNTCTRPRHCATHHGTVHPSERENYRTSLGHTTFSNNFKYFCWIYSSPSGIYRARGKSWKCPT